MKKALLNLFAASIAASLGHYVQETQAGHHFAFTFGNIALPILVGVGLNLAGLFQKPPTP